jgi:hypothetical protein
MVHPEPAVLSTIPEHHHTIFKICMVFLTRSFVSERAEKRLEIKSLKGPSKAEDLRAPCPEFFSFRPSLKVL